MLDPLTPKGRIISAALACCRQALGRRHAARHRRGGQAAAGRGEARLCRQGRDPCRASCVRSDDEVLKRAPKQSDGQDKRDVLFDVVMTRF